MKRDTRQQRVPMETINLLKIKFPGTKKNVELFRELNKVLYEQIYGKK